MITKLRKKLLHYQRMVVPYNLHLRPAGVFQRQGKSNVEFKEVLPAYNTTLQVPEYLFTNLSPFTIYDKIVEDQKYTLTVTTDYVVCKAPKGRIYSNNNNLISIVSEDNQLIGEVSFQYKKGKTVGPAESPILDQKYFETPQYYKGTVFNMLAGGGAARGNYGHWLMDVVPRLFLLKESGYFDEVDWFLVPQYKHDFQKQTLNYFGIKDHQIIEGSDSVHIQADNVIASTHPRGEKSFLITRWVVDFYQKQFGLEKYDDPNSPKLIYINRKDSSQRGVVNEDELIAELEALGFKSLQSSDYDFFEKIRLFRNADIVVSSTGAALATLFFCRKNTKVLELFSKSFTHTHYFNISSMIGLDYNCLIFDSENPAENMRQGLTDHLKVDPKVVADRVKAMMV